MNGPKLVNIKNDKNAFQERGSLYIGRPKAGGIQHFGNPWSHLNVPNTIKVDSRETAVENYEKWIEGTDFQEVEPRRRRWILTNLDKVRKASKAVCFCAPERCHGEPLIKKAMEG